jgi:transposase-like protein
MKPPRITPEQRAQVGVLARAGASIREIATQVGVSRSTAHKIVSQIGKAEAALTVPSASSAQPAGAADTTLEFVRAEMRRCQALSDAASAAGNFGAAQRAARDAAQFATIVVRLERDAPAAFHSFSEEQLRAAEESVERKIAEVGHRPLLCAHCNRALSLQWADTGDAEGGSDA